MINAPKEQESGEPFNFRKELNKWLKEGTILDEYYQVETKYKKDPDQVSAQVSRKVHYLSTRRNAVQDTLEASIIPQTFKTRCQIITPPVVPFVVDEDMPDELSVVAKSDNPSKPPQLNKLKCVEIQIDHESLFSNGTTRKTDETYRIDLTQEKPVVYKRMQIQPEEKTEKEIQGKSTLTAIRDYLEPTARFTYKKVDTSELKRITQIINQTRQEQFNSSSL